MSMSAVMKERFYNEGRVLPLCVNDGCDRNVAVREWKNWSFKSECSSCSNRRIKTGVMLEGVTQHKKTYCENVDGQLGFSCPVPRDNWKGFFNSLDLDHIDGDHYNNVPENVKTFCKLCHGRKSVENGDCNSHKFSARRMEVL